MQALRFPLKTYEFSAIVELLGPGTAPGSSLVRLLFDNGYIEAHAWLFDPFMTFPSVPTAHVTVIETPDAKPRYILAACHFDDNLAPAPLFCHTLCPITGVVTQTRDLIQSIQSKPLRQFVYAALTQSGAALGYWTAPASLCDHHNYEGGLAHHSLEVATMVGSSTGLPPDDRDAGIALALLHDYGKIWCYRDGEYTAAHKRGHARVGLEKLTPQLECLRHACPTTAAKMVELLGGPTQRTNRRYPLAVGRIVNAFDQMSCEKARRQVEAEAQREDEAQFEF